MTPAEITHKLTMIRTLPAGEDLGWHGLVTGSAPYCRPPFPGEISALILRARQLNVTLPS